MIEAAREKLDAKRWKDAVNLLKRVTSVERSNAIANALLAFAYLNQRKVAEAEKMIARALQTGAMEPEVHRQHGRMLHLLGRFDASANAYTQALQLKPDYGDVYRDLGILLLAAGVLDQATEALVMAVQLDPRDAMAFYHLGLIKRKQGKDTEALDAFGMATALKPDYAEAHVNLGKLAIDCKRYELGEKACLRAIEADPSVAQAYINLGMVKRAQGNLEEAIRYGKRGVELDPMSGGGYSNLGNAYMDLHRYQEALACFRKAMEYQPSFANSYFNCGNALRLLHDLDRANQYYNKAIDLEPARCEFMHNQGLVYQEQGRDDEALARFREAVTLAPNIVTQHFSLARSLWRNGLFEESWKYFDAGLAANLRKPNRRFRQPRWQGEDISEKRILVWREQGVGDEIDFARRYQHMVDAAGEVLIEADKRMVELFQRSFPKAKVLPENLNAENDQGREDCDVHLPAGNLLQYFPYTQEELSLVQCPRDDVEAAFLCGERNKGATGYLVADPERTRELGERVAALPEGLRVGIGWRSQYSHRDRDIHYTKLEMWESILRLPGITFVNVQYDQREEELLAVEQALGVKIHRWHDLDLKNDLEGAFALTANLDMVISTPTSPNRIASAVGKEVWLMMAAGREPNQPPQGDYGIGNRLIWRRHWTEQWPVLIQRMARALEARLKG